MAQEIPVPPGGGRWARNPQTGAFEPLPEADERPPAPETPAASATPDKKGNAK